jgi:hypothetical protein
VLQITNPLHHELIEVRGENDQKAQTLKQWIPLIRGLVKNATIELQPRNIPIQEVCGIDVKIDFFGSSTRTSAFSHSIQICV